jgi:hypothetical protein
MAVRLEVGEIGWNGAKVSRKTFGFGRNSGPIPSGLNAENPRKTRENKNQDESRRRNFWNFSETCSTWG